MIWWFLMMYFYLISFVFECIDMSNCNLSGSWKKYFGLQRFLFLTKYVYHLKHFRRGTEAYTQWIARIRYINKKPGSVQVERNMTTNAKYYMKEFHSAKSNEIYADPIFFSSTVWLLHFHSRMLHINLYGSYPYPKLFNFLIYGFYASNNTPL